MAPTAMKAKRHPALTEAISALLVREPFFASLLLDLCEVVETKDLPDGSTLKTTATDGKHIWVNSESFAKYNIDERIGLLAHEVDHVIFQHAKRQMAYVQLGLGPDMKTFSRKKFGHAADYIINAHLTSLGFKLPLGSLQNSQVTKDDIVDEVYLKLPDDEEDKPDGVDQHVEGLPGDQENTATVQAALQKAKEIAKMQGKGAGGLERFIEDFCSPKVTWQEYIRKAIISHTRGKDDYTWARPNRRKMALAPHVYMPGRSGRKGPRMGVEIDTSGSIGEEELKVFLGELSGILDEIQPELIYVMYVDDALHGDVIEIDDANQLAELGQKAGGGGGTDMTVAYRVIEEQQLPVETLIVFTDGYTGFGEPMPGVETIWAITTPGITAPHGVTVHVPLGEQNE